MHVRSSRVADHAPKYQLVSEIFTKISIFGIKISEEPAVKRQKELDSLFDNEGKNAADMAIARCFYTCGLSF